MPYRLLIASLGNPLPLSTTRHSAGHILLKALAPLIASSQSADLYTLHQSSSFMNVSGKNISRRYESFLIQTVREDGVPSGLVVLHDELEIPLGKIKLRRGGKEVSDKGHRGVRSVIGELGRKGLLGSTETEMKSVGDGRVMARGNKTGRWGRLPVLVRIGVGMGRPEGRGKEAVSEFVLREMGRVERQKVEAAAGEVWRLLERERERVEKELMEGAGVERRHGELKL